jgi:hypothetical protein
MALALGKVGMRPADFWAMSWLEFQHMAEGFAEFHGGGSDKVTPTAEEAADIVARGEATLRKQGKL